MQWTRAHRIKLGSESIFTEHICFFNNHYSLYHSTITVGASRGGLIGKVLLHLWKWSKNKKESFKVVKASKTAATVSGGWSGTGIRGATCPFSMIAAGYMALLGRSRCAGSSIIISREWRYLSGREGEPVNKWEQSRTRDKQQPCLCMPRDLSPPALLARMHELTGLKETRCWAH